MAFKEVFKNPTVKQVVFQLAFPNFFGMESKIGDYQLRIMGRLPKSALLIQNEIIIPINPNKDSKSENENRPRAKKIWQFKSQEEDVILNISSDSLEIISTKHKTYNNDTSDAKFRDIISFLVGEFLNLIPLFLISKIGLRYIDDCPIPEKLTKETFLEYYNSFINFSNVNQLEEIDVLDFTLISRSDGLFLRHRETLQKKPDGVFKYSMDFDGQMNNIKASTYLDQLDLIHQKIADLFQNVIKEPVIKIMNQ